MQYPHSTGVNNNDTVYHYSNILDHIPSTFKYIGPRKEVMQYLFKELDIIVDLLDIGTKKHLESTFPNLYVIVFNDWLSGEMYLNYIKDLPIDDNEKLVIFKRNFFIVATLDDFNKYFVPVKIKKSHKYSNILEHQLGLETNKYQIKPEYIPHFKNTLIRFSIPVKQHFYIQFIGNKNSINNTIHRLNLLKFIDIHDLIDYSGDVLLNLNKYNDTDVIVILSCRNRDFHIIANVEDFYRYFTIADTIQLTNEIFNTTIYKFEYCKVIDKGTKRELSERHPGIKVLPISYIVKNTEIFHEIEHAPYPDEGQQLILLLVYKQTEGVFNHYLIATEEEFNNYIINNNTSQSSVSNVLQNISHYSNILDYIPKTFKYIGPKRGFIQFFFKEEDIIIDLLDIGTKKYLESEFSNLYVNFFDDLLYGTLSLDYIKNLPIDDNEKLVLILYQEKYIVIPIYIFNKYFVPVKIKKSHKYSNILNYLSTKYYRYVGPKTDFLKKYSIIMLRFFTTKKDLKFLFPSWLSVHYLEDILKNKSEPYYNIDLLPIKENEKIVLLTYINLNIVATLDDFYKYFVPVVNKKSSSIVNYLDFNYSEFVPKRNVFKNFIKTYKQLIFVVVSVGKKDKIADELLKNNPQSMTVYYYEGGNKFNLYRISDIKNSDDIPDNEIFVIGLYGIKPTIQYYLMLSLNDFYKNFIPLKKQEKQSSYPTGDLWISPNGDAYSVTQSHFITAQEIIKNNKALQEYLEKYYHRIDPVSFLLKIGWIRVAKLNYQMINIEIHNLRKAKDALIMYLSFLPKNIAIYIEVSGDARAFIDANEAIEHIDDFRTYSSIKESNILEQFNNIYVPKTPEFKKLLGKDSDFEVIKVSSLKNIINDEIYNYYISDGIYYVNNHNTLLYIDFSRKYLFEDKEAIVVFGRYRRNKRLNYMIIALDKFIENFDNYNKKKYSNILNHFTKEHFLQNEFWKLVLPFTDKNVEIEFRGLNVLPYSKAIKIYKLDKTNFITTDNNIDEIIKDIQEKDKNVVILYLGSLLSWTSLDYFLQHAIVDKRFNKQASIVDYFNKDLLINTKYWYLRFDTKHGSFNVDVTVDNIMKYQDAKNKNYNLDISNLHCDELDKKEKFNSIKKNNEYIVIYYISDDKYYSWSSLDYFLNHLFKPFTKNSSNIIDLFNKTLIKNSDRWFFYFKDEGEYIYIHVINALPYKQAIKKYALNSKYKFIGDRLITNDDYIVLFCKYNFKKQKASLDYYYTNIDYFLENSKNNTIVNSNIKTFSSFYGWMSPEGEYYAINDSLTTHAQLAVDILKNKLKYKEEISKLYKANYILLNMGWLRIDGENIEIGNYKKAKDSLIEYLSLLPPNKGVFIDIENKPLLFKSPNEALEYIENVRLSYVENFYGLISPSGELYQVGPNETHIQLANKIVLNNPRLKQFLSKTENINEYDSESLKLLLRLGWIRVVGSTIEVVNYTKAKDALIYYLSFLSSNNIVSLDIDGEYRTFSNPKKVLDYLNMYY